MSNTESTPTPTRKKEILNLSMDKAFNDWVREIAEKRKMPHSRLVEYMLIPGIELVKAEEAARAEMIEDLKTTAE